MTVPLRDHTLPPTGWDRWLACPCFLFYLCDLCKCIPPEVWIYLPLAACIAYSRYSTTAEDKFTNFKPQYLKVYSLLLFCRVSDYFLTKERNFSRFLQRWALALFFTLSRSFALIADNVFLVERSKFSMSEHVRACPSMSEPVRACPSPVLESLKWKLGTLANLFTRRKLLTMLKLTENGGDILASLKIDAI